MAATAVGPAKRLLGAVIPNGWTVIAEVPRKPGATGGRFSHGYIVESSSGKRAFLKALDYSDAAAGPDPALQIKAITDTYVFERDLLVTCRDKRLNRIVRAIDDGKLGSSPNDLVLYLVFELADGDVRQHVVSANKIELAWRLRVLHQIATGLKQLHSQSIAHQDLKPSNVLLFGSEDSKLADLGRAAVKGYNAPHEALTIAGDRSYAPPELLYHRPPPDWDRRRLACDAYLLGSMVVYFFTGHGMTQLLVGSLSHGHRPFVWAGSFDEVMPYIREAFAHVLDAFGTGLSESVRTPLVTIVRELCEPEPARRGHPKNLASPPNQYSLERYVTQFDLLARKAEIGLF